MTLIRRRSLEAETLRGRAAAASAVHEPVTFSELDGVRYLHFGSEWVQGGMRIKKPDALEIEYTQQMCAWLLFLTASTPGFHVAQLGLGAGSLTKFCYRQLKGTRVTAVEVNPAVVVAARCMFNLPDDDERLSVIETSAWDWVNDPAQVGGVDALQVDLYDAAARGPVLDSTAFYRACRRTLKSPGIMTVNLFGDHDSFAVNIRRICDAFDNRVLVFPEVHDGNVVAVAFNGPELDVAWSQVAARAQLVEKTTGVPATLWPDALRRANARQEARLKI